jgi:hypothetical protein
MFLCYRQYIVPFFMLLGIAITGVIGIIFQNIGLIDSFLDFFGSVFIFPFFFGFFLIGRFILVWLSEKNGHIQKDVSLLGFRTMLAVALIAIYSFLIGMQYPFYLAGVSNLGLGLFFPWFALGVTILYLLFDMDLRQYFKPTDRKMHTLRSFVLVITCVLLVFSIILSYSRMNQGKVFMRGVEEYLTPRVDISQIQKWRITLHYDPEYSPTVINQSQWPDFIKRISPSHVHVNYNGDLNIIWGSGFYHWGWVIVPTGKRVAQPSSKQQLIAGGYLWTD